MTKLNVYKSFGRIITPSDMFYDSQSVSVLSALPAAKIFILVSKSIFNNYKSTIEKTFSKFFYNINICPSCEPVLENINSLQNKLKIANPDWIVCIGGGSVMDTGKLLWSLHEHPDLILRGDGFLNRVPELRGKCKLACVPTTFGSGSEMSSAAVFQKSEVSQKSFLVGPELIPDVVILDPDFLLSAPFHVKRDSVLDALTHSIEGYVSKNSNVYTQDLSELSCKKILESINSALSDNQNKKDLFSLLRASNVAGLIQNMSTPGLAHSLSHVLTKLNYSHGYLCGLFLPMVMRFNSKDKLVKERFDQLAKCINLKNCDYLIKKIEEILEKYNVVMDMNIKNFLNSENDLFKKILTDPTAKANPINLSEENLNDFLTENI